MRNNFRHIEDKILELLGWFALALVVIVVMRFAWHLYRMKTDRYYKFKVHQAVIDQAGEKNAARLREMAATTQNPHIRELAEKLVGKKEI